jgi:adenylate kinase
MLNVVLLGAPGSGKGTQSELIIKKYGLRHISTGDILREEIRKDSELGKTAAQFMNDGKLIPDELIINILSRELDANPAPRGIVFDGFPRTIAQAEALENLLRERGQNVVAVISLEVEEKELIERMLNRGREMGRSDDNIETIQNRLQVYHSQTEPLKSYYIKKGKLFVIKGKSTIESVFESITAVLDRLNFSRK